MRTWELIIPIGLLAICSLFLQRSLPSVHAEACNLSANISEDFQLPASGQGLTTSRGFDGPWVMKDNRLFPNGRTGLEAIDITQVSPFVNDDGSPVRALHILPGQLWERSFTLPVNINEDCKLYADIQTQSKTSDLPLLEIVLSSKAKAANPSDYQPTPILFSGERPVPLETRIVVAIPKSFRVTGQYGLILSSAKASTGSGESLVARIGLGEPSRDPPKVTNLLRLIREHPYANQAMQIVDLNGQLNQAQNTIKEMAHNITSLQNQFNESDTRLRQQIHLNTESQQRSRDSGKRIEELQNQSNKLKEDQHGVNQELATARSTVNQLSRELDTARNQNETRSNDLNQSRSANANLEAQLNTIRTQTTELNTDNKSLSSELAQANTIIQSLEGTRIWLWLGPVLAFLTGVVPLSAVFVGRYLRSRPEEPIDLIQRIDQASGQWATEQPIAQTIVDRREELAKWLPNEAGAFVMRHSELTASFRQLEDVKERLASRRPLVQDLHTAEQILGDMIIRVEKFDSIIAIVSARLETQAYSKLKDVGNVPGRQGVVDRRAIAAALLDEQRAKMVVGFCNRAGLQGDGDR